jgi:hypothetical protein
MTKTETAWVAGFLEGEGCFTNNKVQGREYPCIQVATCDRDVLEKFISIIGHGRVRGPYASQQRKAHHLPQYRFSVSGKRAAAIMRAIYPHMGERRKAAIEPWLEVFDLRR